MVRLQPSNAIYHYYRESIHTNKKNKKKLIREYIEINNDLQCLAVFLGFSFFIFALLHVVLCCFWQLFNVTNSNKKMKMHTVKFKLKITFPQTYLVVVTNQPFDLVWFRGMFHWFYSYIFALMSIFISYVANLIDLKLFNSKKKKFDVWHIHIGTHTPLWLVEHFFFLFLLNISLSIKIFANKNGNGWKKRE